MTTVSIDNSILNDYATEGWEIAARLTGALAMLANLDERDTCDEIQYAERLLRDGLARVERLALVAFDGCPLADEIKTSTPAA
jgi:hypothetical protein